MTQTHSETLYGILNSFIPNHRHVWRESDTPHAKLDDHLEDEKLLMPGTAEEMNEFCDEAEESSKMRISVNLPTVEIQLR